MLIVSTELVLLRLRTVGGRVTMSRFSAYPPSFGWLPVAWMA